MTTLTPVIHFERYEQCRLLYEQEKYAECLASGLQNLADRSIPRFLEMKTLILLVGAECDSWHKAEEYRLRAESVFTKSQDDYAQRAARMPAGARAVDEAGMKELREELDELQAYQAEVAPISESGNDEMPLEDDAAVSASAYYGKERNIQ